LTGEQRGGEYRGGREGGVGREWSRSRRHQAGAARVILAVEPPATFVRGIGPENAIGFEWSEGMQDEIDVDFVVGEPDLAVVGVVDDAGLEQRLDVAVHGFDVAADPAGDFADREWAGAGQRSQQLQSLGRDRFPQQLGAGEADQRPLVLALERMQPFAPSSPPPRRRRSLPWSWHAPSVELVPEIRYRLLQGRKGVGAGIRSPIPLWPGLAYGFQVRRRRL
jgi:hypothetical protein